MTTAATSLILLGELRNNLEIEELEPSISPYTGKALRQIAFTVTVHGDDDHERLATELDTTRNGKVFISDTNGIRWRVIRNDWSYQQGQTLTRFTHDVVLDEHEELSLTRVAFEGIELTPIQWSLEAHPGDTTVLKVLADLSSGQHQLFEQVLERSRAASDELGYFPVTCVGITENPISMRFGECLWQPLDNDAVRHVIVLVSEENDDPKARGLFEPERTRIKAQSVAATTKLDALIDELHRAGVLEDEAVGRINSRAAAPSFSAWRVFEQTANVEDFFD